MNMQSNNPSYYLDLVLNYIGETTSRLRTEPLSRVDSAALNGKSFSSIHQFEVDTSAPLYVLFENTNGEGVNVELIERFFQTSDYGADILVYWDYDVTNATKTSISTFNNNSNYRNTVAELEISILNTNTLNENTGVYIVSDQYVPTDTGIIREPGQIVSSGVGRNQSGDINTGTGVRIYGPNTGFLVKVTSTGNSNIITLGYTWNEVES